jgi:hypothetical protein
MAFKNSRVAISADKESKYTCLESPLLQVVAFVDVVFDKIHE